MRTGLIDLSGNNPDPIDFARARAVGVQALLHKATQGVSAGDKAAAPAAQLCVRRCAAARSAGLLVGAYHYLMVRHGRAQDARQQAADYLAVWRAVSPDLVPMLDVETAYNTRDRHGALLPPELRATVAECTQAVVDFVDQVRHDTGLSPGIYTSGGEWDEMGLSPLTSLADCPLWLAVYSSSPTYRVPAPWTSAAARQWAGDGRVDGITGPVDVSELLDRDALRVAA